jgi:hypothetical protein
MTLDMPTPESLEAEANDLERRAATKEAHADRYFDQPDSLLRRDAAIFREEAKAKRAKAERMRKAAQS